MPQPSVARAGSVADGETVARLAAEKVGSAALVAPENAGPTTAITFELPTRLAATDGEIVPDPWSSEAVNASLNGRCPNWLVPALAWLIANSTANFMFRPSWALPPDSGPS